MAQRLPLTISLPKPMADQVRRISEQENRTTSELVREALRRYFDGVPVVTVTRSELRAIDKGREQIRRGNSVSLNEMIHGLANNSRKTSRKKTRKGSGARSH